MIINSLREKRLKDLSIPAETKGELYQKFSYISRQQVSLIINKCIVDNRNIPLDQAKRLSIIWPKEYEMFLERIRGVL